MCFWCHIQEIIAKPNATKTPLCAATPMTKSCTQRSGPTTLVLNKVVTAHQAPTSRIWNVGCCPTADCAELGDGDGGHCSGKAETD